jgi:hypothetical protein
LSTTVLAVAPRAELLQDFATQVLTLAETFIAQGALTATGEREQMEFRG